MTSSDSPVINFGAGNFVHLGLGASIATLPTHTGDMSWYQTYGETHASDGTDGRLVSLHTFSESWDTWEVHPNGHELVLITAGRMTLTQELLDSTIVTVTLETGEAVVNEPGVWHTADVEPGETATALFITAGVGTEIRPRG